MNRSYSVRVLRSIPEVEEIRPLWTAWQAHPNSDLDFFLLILKSRPQIVRPHVLLISTEEGPRALVAEELETGPVQLRIGYRRVAFSRLTTITLIYGGVLGDWEDDMAGAVVQSLRESLRNKEADRASFSPLREGSAMLREAMTAPHWLCRERYLDFDAHWAVRVPETAEAFWAGLSNHHRSFIRQKQRKLEREYPGKVLYRVVSRAEDVGRLCEQLERIAAMSYLRRINAGFADNAETRQRLTGAAERGRLRAYLVEVEGVPVAYELGTLHGTTFYADFTSYDPEFHRYNVGEQAMLYAIESLCKEGTHWFDIGTGDATYKQRVGSESWMESGISIYAPRVKPVLLNLVASLLAGGSGLLQAMAASARVQDLVKRIWRKRLRATEVEPSPSAG